MRGSNRFNIQYIFQSPPRIQRNIDWAGYLGGTVLLLLAQLSHSKKVRGLIYELGKEPFCVKFMCAPLVHVVLGFPHMGQKQACLN